MSDDMPPWLRARHPELDAVHAALVQHRDGAPITARCIACDAILIVTRVDATGATVVGCPCGTTYARFVARP